MRPCIVKEASCHKHGDGGSVWVTWDELGTEKTTIFQFRPYKSQSGYRIKRVLSPCPNYLEKIVRALIDPRNLFHLRCYREEMYKELS